MRGHARKRAKGTWELRAWDSVTKSYRYRTVEASSKREAEKLLSAFVAEVDAGRAPKAPAKLTVAEVCEQWLEVKRFGSEGTRTQHEWAIYGHIIPKLGKLSVRKLELQHIERFYRSLEAKLAARSVRHVHASLRQVLEYARRGRVITHNPATDVAGLPSVDDRRVNSPEPDEVNDMLAAMAAKDHQWYSLTKRWWPELGSAGARCARCAGGASIWNAASCWSSRSRSR